MKFRIGLVLIWATAVWLIAAPGLMAQDSGGVSGAITSQSGAPIPNVAVTLTSNGTGEQRITNTGTDGTFSFAALAPGDYSIAFKVNGYRSLQISSFAIDVAASPIINRSLLAGQSDATPVVEARAENLPTTAIAANTLSTEAVNEVPLATRNFTQAAAQNAGSNASLPNASTQGRNDTDMAASGAGTAQNAFEQDGVIVLAWFNAGSAVEGSAYASLAAPSPDAIQEVKVDTTNIDASFGRQPGAHSNVILRSGGNAWHGSAFEFFRNTALNSNEYFRELLCNNSKAAVVGQTNLCGATLQSNGTYAGGTNKLVLNQNQFGGVVGGPVKKDKLYVFLSYQQTWQKNGFTPASAATGTYSPNPVLPPMATTAGSNNWFNAPGSRSGANLTAFENSLGAIYSHVGPASPAPCDVPSGCYPISSYNSGAGSMGVSSTGGNINAAALSMLEATLPNGQYVMPGSTTGAEQNANYSIPGYFPMWQGIGNFDYLLNSHNTFSGRYVHEDENIQGGFCPGTAASNAVPGCISSVKPSYTTELLRLTSVMNQHTVNEVRFSWQLNSSNVVTIAPASWNATSIYAGIPVVTAYGATTIPVGCGMVSCAEPQAPSVSISSNYIVGTCAACDSSQHGPQFQAADTVSWTHGKHTLRFGWEYDRAGDRFVFPGMSRGQEAFNTFQDFLIGLPGNCGAPVAGVCNGGALSNIVNTSLNSQAVGPQAGAHDYLVTGYAAYIQDDFKVTRNLTVNIGMRWEYNSAAIDQGGNFSNIWLSALNLDPVPAVAPGTTPYVLGTYYGYSSPQAACVAPRCIPPPVGATYTGYVVPANDDIAGYGPLPSGIITNSRNDTYVNSQPLDNFGPRLGFAYSPLKNNKMVVRGGVGYFYSRLPGGQITRPSYSPPGTRTDEASGAANAFASEEEPYAANVLGTFPVRWVNLNNLAGATSGSFPTYQQSSNIQQYINGYLVSPLVYTWNMSVQYEVAPTWVVTVGYQGSHGIHQIGTQEQANAANLATTTNPINGLTSSTVANTSLRVPYLGFAAAGLLDSQTNNNYKFNSLQATLNKRLSHGVSINASYTLARAFIQSDFYNNPNIFNYIPNSAYRPQRFIVRYSWNIPGSHLSGMKGKVLGGWSVTGVTTVQNGTPLTFTDNRGGSIYGMNSSTIQFITAELSGAAGVNLATTGPITSRLGGTIACLPVACANGYVNKGYFTTEPDFVPNVSTSGTVYGNSGNGILLGPGQFNFDASLTKTMVVGGLRENARLQFRTEFYNMFNHPQFSNPGTAFNAGTSFGNITSTSVNPRLIQFGLKYLF